MTAPGASRVDERGLGVGGRRDDARGLDGRGDFTERHRHHLLRGVVLERHEDGILGFLGPTHAPRPIARLRFRSEGPLAGGRDTVNFPSAAYPVADDEMGPPGDGGCRLGTRGEVVEPESWSGVEGRR